MVLNVFLTPKLWRDFHQVMCLFIGLADMLQCGSWFVGNRSSLNECRMQEYLLQIGCLLKGYWTVVISSTSWSMIHRMQQLTIRDLGYHLTISIFIPLSFWMSGIFFKSADIFCDSRVSKTPVYVLTFLFPLLICIIVNTILYFHIISQVKSLQFTFSDSSPETKLLKMVRRLKYFPIILSLGWSLDLIAVMWTLLTGHYNLILDILSALGVCSSGVLVSSIYFYHQEDFPPLLRNVASLAVIMFGLKRVGHKEHPNTVPLASTTAIQSPLHQKKGKESNRRFLNQLLSPKSQRYDSSAVASSQAFMPSGGSAMSCSTPTPDGHRGEGV
jgi:hypothetical protein